jgi:hypothetical protein
MAGDNVQAMPQLVERVMKRRVISKQHCPNNHSDNSQKNGNLDKGVEGDAKRVGSIFI